MLRNMDVFTLTHSDMTGINPVHASHKLNVIPSARPIRLKVRHFHPDRHRVIKVEVDNLLKARFIKEIKYPELLANVVVVPKKGRKWRVCVDYTDLNVGKTMEVYIDDMLVKSNEHPDHAEHLQEAFELLLA